MIFLKKIHGNMICSSNVLKRWSFQKSCTGIWPFLYSEERWHFFFPKIWYFFYRRKMKDDISQKIHGNMMFSVCWKSSYFFFLQIWNYPSVKKTKIIFSRKNTHKDDISGITEKDDIHPRKDDIGILCTFMETF